MASETGHAKNIANFETLISVVQSFNTAYNPPRTNMKLPALVPMPGLARDAIQEVNNFQNAQSAAGKQREAAFGDLSKLATRIIAAIEISDAAPLSLPTQLRQPARQLRSVRPPARIPTHHLHPQRTGFKSRLPSRPSRRPPRQKQRRPNPTRPGALQSRHRISRHRQRRQKIHQIRLRSRRSPV
jgi:hypothetical protein